MLINGARTDKTVRLVADGVPAQLDAFVTSASTPLGTQPLRVERDAIVLPARSFMTVVSGSYLDEASPPRGRGEGMLLGVDRRLGVVYRAVAAASVRFLHREARGAPP